MNRAHVIFGVAGHYLLTFYRSLTRHRLYAALNVMGLAVGLAVFLVLMLDVQFETSFDRWIPDAANTYRLDETLTFPGLAPRQSAKTSSVIAPILKSDYPTILAFTRLVSVKAKVKRGTIIGQEDVRYVDPDFFKVLALPLASGDVESSLTAPDNVILTEGLARKYFARTDVLGQTLTLDEDGVPASVRISAVLRDLPKNTHLKLGILKVITPAVEKRFAAFRIWGAQYGSTYLRFRNRADAQSVQADLVNFVDRRAKGDDDTKLGPHPTRRLKLHLTPIPAIHFETGITSGEFQQNVDAGELVSLGLLGALTLAIAVFNYINLATARSGMRAREVAIRKALGATRKTLITQFVAEAFATTALAVIIGLALAEVALPIVNTVGGSTLQLRYLGPGGVLPILGILTLTVGCAAGFYPALVLSKYQPARVLASSRMGGGGRIGSRIRDILVLVQFALAIGFGACTLVLVSQARYIQQADRGFQHDRLILVESLATKSLLERQPVILDALRREPGVEVVSSSIREPNSQIMNAVKTSVPGAKGPAPTLTMDVIGPRYFETYGASIVAGRQFDTAHKADDTNTDGDGPMAFNIMLNQTAAASLGFSSPSAAIGKTITLENHAVATVVGVARDIRFVSPHDPVQPLMYVFTTGHFDGAIAAVRFHGDSREMMRQLERAWRRVVPDEPFVGSTADVRLSTFYVADQQRARLFVIGSALAVGLACVGLYGLAAFNTARRVKEIGIRKALGASTKDILRLLIGQFLRPVALANLIAWPLAWWAMRIWLDGFSQRIALSPLYFFAATAVTLVIAVATVAGQALAVARADPARALRDE